MRSAMSRLVAPEATSVTTSRSRSVRASVSGALTRSISSALTVAERYAWPRAGDRVEPGNPNDTSVGPPQPPIVSTIVVLPAPLGPSNPNVSPAATSKLTSSTTVFSPYRLVRHSTLMVVMPAMFARAGASVRQPVRRVRLAERLICVVDRFRHPGYLTCPSASGCWPQTKLGGEEPPMTRRLALAAAAAAATLAASAFAQEPLIFDSSLGEVEIFPLGHASLRIEVNDVVMHIDPWSNVADYST